MYIRTLRDFCQAAFQLGGTQHVLVAEIVLPQLQDFALPLVELYEVLVSPLLQLVPIPLEHNLTPRCITLLPKFAESTLCPTI